MSKWHTGNWPEDFYVFGFTVLDLWAARMNGIQPQKRKVGRLVELGKIFFTSTKVLPLNTGILLVTSKNFSHCCVEDPLVVVFILGTFTVSILNFIYTNVSVAIQNNLWLPLSNVHSLVWSPSNVGHLLEYSSWDVCHKLES